MNTKRSQLVTKGYLPILNNNITEISDVYFIIGNKEFKIDSIKWERSRSFRRHIPYSIYHKTWYSFDLEIKNPPQFSGKGENSWDCGDDGICGLSSVWKDEIPNWTNREECAKKAAIHYIESVFNNAKRYGGSSGKNGIRHGLPYQYIGRKPNESNGQENRK